MMRVPRTLLSGLALLSLCAAAFADGGVFELYKQDVLPGRPPSQSVQQSLIAWSGGMESLHLRSNYRGRKASFAWVVPVPSRPTVEKSSWEAFSAAEEATRPLLVVTRYEWGRRRGCGCGGQTQTNRSDEMETGVTVFESLEIEELHVDILAATGAAGLVEWLRTNEYAVPERAQSILDEYIQQDFFFVAVKVRKEDLPADDTPGTDTVDTGLTPLAISFASPRPFFPLKISRVSSAAESEILLLVVTPQPVMAREYELVQVTQADVDRTFAPERVQFQETLDLNLGPAVHRAQSRCAGLAMVLETRSHVPRDQVAQARRSAGREPLKRFLQSPPSPLRADDSPWITRVHAFLKPQDMFDVTFTPVEYAPLVSSVFRVNLGTVREGFVPVGVMMGALVALAVSWRRENRGRVRMIAITLLLLLGSCL
jgi:hypothetical protein